MTEYPQIDTFEQFLELVPKDGWYMNGVQIRRGPIGSSEPECQCPITALANAPSWKFCSTAKLFGISDELRERILDAADHRDPIYEELPHQRWVADRAALLQALNLQEAS